MLAQSLDMAVQEAREYGEALKKNDKDAAEDLLQHLDLTEFILASTLASQFMLIWIGFLTGNDVAYTPRMMTYPIPPWDIDNSEQYKTEPGNSRAWFDRNMYWGLIIGMGYTKDCISKSEGLKYKISDLYVYEDNGGNPLCYKICRKFVGNVVNDSKSRDGTLLPRCPRHIANLDGSN